MAGLPLGREVSWYLLWSRDSSRLYFEVYDFDAEYGYPFVADLSTGEVTPSEVHEDSRLSFDQRWLLERDSTSNFFIGRRLDGREARPVVPVAKVYASRLYWSYRDNFVTYEGKEEDSPASCNGPDTWAIGSLLNGAAELRLTRLPSGFGVRVTGTAADLHLDSYLLEFAPVSSPEAFTPIQPLSNVPVVDDLFTTWLPPEPGDYLVKLTLRDLAGNETARLERIFWEETLPIAALTRVPEHISPNGDGVQDEAVFSYTVLEPVNLEFNVRDQENRIVRTIPRDESTLGPASFIWDGTDDAGTKVPDGDYTVEVRGAEFPVMVDATPPDIEAAYSDLYTNNVLVIDLEGRIRDTNLRGWLLATAAGNKIDSGVREVGDAGDDHAVILPTIAPIQGTELRASDFAGNATVVPLTGPAREMRVIRSHIDVDAMVETTAIGPFAPGPPDLPSEVVAPPESRFGWVVESSISIPDLVFRYRKQGEASFIERPAKRFFNLDASELEIGKRYEAHFAAGDLQSQGLSFLVGPDAIFVEAQLAGGGIAVEHISTLSERVVEMKMILIIDGQSSVAQVKRPIVSSDWLVPAEVACGNTVAVQIEALGVSGQTYYSTTFQAYPSIQPAPVALRACIELTGAGIQPQLECGGSVPSTVMVSVRSSRLPLPAESVVLLAGSEGLPLTEVGSVSPEGQGPDFQVAVPWDVTEVPEGDYTLRAKAYLIDGSSIDSSLPLRLYLDASPPEVAIPDPPEGHNVCFVTDEKGDEWVEIDVFGSDRLLNGYDVERLVETAPEIWQPVETKPLEPVTELPVAGELHQRLLAKLPVGFEGELTLRFVVQTSRIPSEVPESSGDNGSLLGCAVRRVLVLRAEPLSSLSSEPAGASPFVPPLFSPNDDGGLDQLTVYGELSEAATVTASVFPFGGETAIRRLDEDAVFGAGLLELTWDGKDDAAQVVADGLYRVMVEAVNGCGITSVRELEVEIDTTPPRVQIDQPTEGQPVAASVEVTGTAMDVNMLHYQLEVGEGRTPSDFVLAFGPAEREVEGQTLGLWEVGEIAGEYSLRLTAEDRAGNRASTQVIVDVRAPDLIWRFAADPTLFSPNGDGIKDTSELTLGLEADALVTLDIRRPDDDTLVSRLLDNELLVAGDHTLVWDGEGAPDGEYVAVAVAVDAVVTTKSEEASLSLVVDKTPPSIAIDHPASGSFVPLLRDLNGSIEDQHLEGYEMALGPEEGVLLPVEQGSLPVTGHLARIPALEDGAYRLRVRATDLAGNSSEVTVTFTADSTSPLLSLNAPEAEAFLRKDQGPIPIVGTLIEPNLEAYELQFGLGAPPRAFVTLAGGPSLESKDFVVDWEVAELPDGLYTLKLTATDLAGSTSELTRLVTLDGSPPVVSIDSPADGAMVSETQPVLGSVWDDHLENGILEVAPGTLEGAFQFTELSRITEPVQGGEIHSGLALEDGAYTLKLTATDRAGNIDSVSRGFAIDTEPPAAPAGLTAEVQDLDDVQLDWQANAEPDLAGYLVFRDGTLLTAMPIPAPTYLDPDRSEGRFEYVVKAVDQAELESEPSAPVEVMTDLTPPMVTLSSPENGASLRGLIDITGTAFSEGDFKEYRLSYASAAAPQSPTLLKRSPVPALFDRLFQWQVIAFDGTFILTLEAEDLQGNLASDEVRVIVDNLPPGAPALTLVKALGEPDEDHVEVSWEAVDEPDVAGYIVFRNGQVANAPGPVSGDLGPYLIEGTAYIDIDLPDGDFCYRVAAMDQARNLGPDSNEMCESLDNRVPKAVVYDPVDGTRFDQSRQVRALSEDEDLVSVLFQFRKGSAVNWTDISTDTELPFEVFWDIDGLEFGPYQLRAVATDAGLQSDPDPVAIDVILDDATPPETPANLEALTSGDDVALSWDPVSDADLESYLLYRDGLLVATLDASITSTEDLDLPDGLYRYELTAMDAKANESAPGDPAEARIYAPLIIQPFPIFEAASIDVVGTEAEPNAVVRLTEVGLSEILGETKADGDGNFVIGGVTLPEGMNLLEAKAANIAGNTSRASEPLVLIRNVPPATPLGFSGVSNDKSAELAWSANTEADIAGYHVYRDDTRLTVEEPVRSGLSATASSSTSSGPPSRAIDGSSSTTWTSRYQNPFVIQWLEIQLDPPREIREVDVSWFSGYYAGLDYRVLAELGGALVPVAAVQENDAIENQHRFPFAFRTGKIRIEITALQSSFSRVVRIREVTLVGDNAIVETSFSDTPTQPGSHEYRVSAIDFFGGESVPTEPFVHRLFPPEPPTSLVALVNGADVELSWNPSASPEVTGYRILRDGEPLTEVAGLAYVDVGLSNGVYVYQVVALEGVDIESAPSNEAEATVSVELPEVPSNLAVTEALGGKALHLSWSPASGPLGVAGYLVLRSTGSGGPYLEVVETTETSYRDVGLESGVEYFYVVRALDPATNESGDSNEASGMLPIPAPLFLYPATPDKPATVVTRRIDLVGQAKPGGSVTVLGDGDEVATPVAEETLREVRNFELLFLDESAGELAVSASRPLAAQAHPHELRLFDLVRGTERTLTLDGREDVSGLCFSPESDRVAVTAYHESSYTDDLMVVDLDTGETQLFDSGGDETWPTWLSESEIAVAVGRDIRAIDLSTGDSRVLYYEVRYPRELLISPDRSQVAYRTGYGELKRLRLSDLTVFSVAANVSGNQYDWTHDGALVYANSAGVSAHDVDLGESTLLPGTEGALWPRAVPDGRLSFLRPVESRLSLHFLDRASGLIEEVGELDIYRYDVELVAWSPDFRLVIGEENGERLSVLFPPGRFELTSIDLRLGENEFAARAGNSAGNESDLSEPVRVTYDSSGLPDLAPEGEILVVPTVPTGGQNVNLSVTLRNQGATEAPSTLVQATGNDTSGNVYVIGTMSLPALSPGASVPVTFAWNTAGRLGQQEIYVRVDPLDFLDELDETNNLATATATVVGVAGIELVVTTGLPSYSPEHDVKIAVSAVNGGPGRNVVLETWIEDALGLSMALVDERPASLAYGDAESYSVFWNTGGSLTGEYRVRVNATESGVVVASITTSFDINRVIDIHAIVLSAKPSYPQGASIDLLGQLIHSRGNAALRDLLARFRVVAAGGAELFESSRVLSYLAIGGRVAFDATWNQAAPEPGTYSILFDVFEEDLLLASATSSVDVVAASGPELVGTLNVVGAVPLGGEVVAEYQVMNQGVVDLVGGTIRVELLDPISGLRRVAGEVAANIDAGSGTSGEIGLDTDGLGFGDTIVLLSAGLPTELEPLDAGDLTLFGVPTTPSLNSPAEAESTVAPPTLSVNNSSSPNGEPLSYMFEIYLDAALQLRVGAASGIPEGSNATGWNVSIFLEENHRYYWRARAEDRLATGDWMSPASLFLDSANEAPGAPTLFAPAADSEVSDRMPVLEVGNAIDAEQTPLEYIFEVYTDPDLADLLTSMVSVPEGPGTTSVTLTEPLEEDHTYYWRCRANDGELDGEWMPVASFRLNTGNQGPAAPVPVSPIEGVSSTASAELVSSLAVDPEGDSLTYTFEIDATDQFSTPLERVEGVLPNASEVVWLVPLTLTENQVYCWRVRATDGLASGDWSAVVMFRVDEVNDAPSVPTLQSPTGGTLVQSLTPTLTVINSTDPEETALTYELEIYSEVGDKVAEVHNLREGEQQTAWITSPRLEEDTTYNWRARASDGGLESGWSFAEAFRVNVTNEAPGAPTLDRPVDKGLVDVPPWLSVFNATDSDGDALTYRFELYEDEILEHLVEASPEIPEETEKTSWQVSESLDEDGVYYWRARASDGGREGAWMDTGRFRFSAINAAPGAPIPSSPEDGAEMNNARPLLVVENATDAEEDALQYVFEVFSDPQLENRILRSGEQPEGDASTSWQVAPDLEENELFYWHAWATDGLLEGPPSEVSVFRVNALHDPPTIPVPLDPANGASVGTTSVRLVVTNAISPDGFSLVYHFVIYRDSDLSDLVQEDVAVPEGDGTTAWDVPVELEPDVSYFWRVKAVDETGAAGAWSDGSQFAVSITMTECPPVWWEDFEGFPKKSVPMGWQLRTESGKADFRVESRHDRSYLKSDKKGRGTFLYVGSGESLGWRNYEVGGQIEVEKSYGKKGKKDDEPFGAGIVFYSDPEGGTEYRLELGKAKGDRLRSRLVKVAGGERTILVEEEVKGAHGHDKVVLYRIEVLNLTAETSIRAHLTTAKDQKGKRVEFIEWLLETADSDEPLRRGTMGAWSNFSKSEWNDFRVQGLPGSDSGISGDEDGDGICDFIDGCPLEICLDEELDPKSHLSRWVVAAEGRAGHSGPTACGAKHSYWVGYETGILTVQTPELEGGIYQFQLLLNEYSDKKPVVRVELSTGESFELGLPSTKGRQHHKEFVWSDEVSVILPAGISAFRVVSIAKRHVFIEAFRLTASCQP